MKTYIEYDSEKQIDTKESIVFLLDNGVKLIIKHVANGIEIYKSDIGMSAEIRIKPRVSNVITVS